MRAGRRATGRAVFEAVGPDLLAYFERRVTPREDAADLLSDTFMTAWRRIEDLPAGDEDRRRWLFGIASRTLSNHRRGMTRRRRLADKLRSRLVSEAAPDVSDGVAIRDVVKRLPEGQRDLVTLVHWERFTVSQAAEILGINPSTARSRYASARAFLRRELAASDDDGGSPALGGSAGSPAAWSSQHHEPPTALLTVGG